MLRLAFLEINVELSYINIYWTCSAQLKLEVNGPKNFGKSNFINGRTIYYDVFLGIKNS